MKEMKWTNEWQTEKVYEQITKQTQSNSNSNIINQKQQKHKRKHKHKHKHIKAGRP